MAEILHQLGLVVYPIYKVSCIPGGAGFLPATVLIFQGNMKYDTKLYTNFMCYKGNPLKLPYMCIKFDSPNCEKFNAPWGIMLFLDLVAYIK